MTHFVENKKISVVVPNYNYAGYIQNRLESILKQTYPIYELIILDDASTDDSVNLITSEVKKIQEKYGDVKIKFLKNKTNSGSVFFQWQKGIKVATGDYVWIAELDDSCSKYFLETALGPTANSKNAIILSYTESRLIGSASIKDNIRHRLGFVRKRHLNKAYIIDGRMELNKNLAVYNSIPNVSACVFKNIPELAVILEEAKKYKLAGDWYFYTKLAEIGSVAYSPKKLNYHRLSANSVTANTKLEERFFEMQKIHKYLYEKEYISDSTKQRMKKLEEKLKKSWHIS